VLIVASFLLSVAIVLVNDLRSATVIVQAEVHGGAVASGAGVIVRESSREIDILTVAHIFRDTAGTVRTTNGEVGFYADPGDPGEICKISDVRLSNDADLAMVIVRPTLFHRYGVVRLASALPNIGDPLTVIGHPNGVLFTESPATVISRRVATYDFAFRCSQCAPGDSGGGVFNARGELVGLVTGIAGLVNDRGELVFAGAGLSIPIPRIDSFLAVLWAF
jgi:S1-C subfamily serine protease